MRTESMENGYFDHHGKFVKGHRVGGFKASASSGEIESAIAESLARCQAGSSAMQELRKILGAYPQLREGGADVHSDVLSPLIECLVAQQFG